MKTLFHFQRPLRFSFTGEHRLIFKENAEPVDPKLEALQKGLQKLELKGIDTKMIKDLAKLMLEKDDEDFKKQVQTFENLLENLLATGGVKDIDMPKDKLTRRHLSRIVLAAVPAVMTAVGTQVPQRMPSAIDMIPQETPRTPREENDIYKAADLIRTKVGKSPVGTKYDALMKQFLNNPADEESKNAVIRELENDTASKLPDRAKTPQGLLDLLNRVDNNNWVTNVQRNMLKPEEKPRVAVERVSEVNMIKLGEDYADATYNYSKRPSPQLLAKIICLQSKIKNYAKSHSEEYPYTNQLKFPDFGRLANRNNFAAIRSQAKNESEVFRDVDPGQPVGRVFDNMTGQTTLYVALEKGPAGAVKTRKDTNVYVERANMSKYEALNAWKRSQGHDEFTPEQFNEQEERGNFAPKPLRRNPNMAPYSPVMGAESTGDMYRRYEENRSPNGSMTRRTTPDIPGQYTPPPMVPGRTRSAGGSDRAPFAPQDQTFGIPETDRERRYHSFDPGRQRLTREGERLGIPNAGQQLTPEQQQYREFIRTHDYSPRVGGGTRAVSERGYTSLPQSPETQAFNEPLPFHKFEIFEPTSKVWIVIPPELGGGQVTFNSQLSYNQKHALSAGEEQLLKNAGVTAIQTKVNNNATYAFHFSRPGTFQIFYKDPMDRMGYGKQNIVSAQIPVAKEQAKIKAAQEKGARARWTSIPNGNPGTEYRLNDDGTLYAKRGNEYFRLDGTTYLWYRTAKPEFAPTPALGSTTNPEIKKALKENILKDFASFKQKVDALGLSGYKIEGKTQPELQEKLATVNKIISDLEFFEVRVSQTLYKYQEEKDSIDEAITKQLKLMSEELKNLRTWSTTLSTALKSSTPRGPAAPEKPNEITPEFVMKEIMSGLPVSTAELFKIQAVPGSPFKLVFEPNPIAKIKGHYGLRVSISKGTDGYTLNSEITEEGNHHLVVDKKTVKDTVELRKLIQKGIDAVMLENIKKVGKRTA